MRDLRSGDGDLVWTMVSPRRGVQIPLRLRGRRRESDVGGGADPPPRLTEFVKDHRTESRGLADRVDVLLESIYDHARGDYDAAYFSGSFMLMPDPAGVLRHVTALLRPEGRVYFTQTFQERRSPVLERAKPLLRKLTTVDFGRVTYEEDFLRTLAEAGLEVETMEVLERHRARTSRLVVATPGGRGNDAARV